MSSGLLIAGGLVALMVGADVLVRAGTGLASWLGIRPMMIGLTVVSLGTSVPELAIGIDAAVSGSPGLAVGNIVGTNLFNILLILGLSAVLVPVALDRATLRFNLPAMAAAALVLRVLSIDGTLARLDGVILLLAGVAYTAGLVQVSRRGTTDPADGPAAIVAGAADRPRPLRHVLVLLVALALVVIGAELLVEGAVSSARTLGAARRGDGGSRAGLRVWGPDLPDRGWAVRRELRRLLGVATPDAHLMSHSGRPVAASH